MHATQAIMNRLTLKLDRRGNRHARADGGNCIKGKGALPHRRKGLSVRQGGLNLAVSLRLLIIFR